ncbi:hypothetical protein QJQ45_026436, partial [Haematococcus lacustris]
VAPGQNTSSGHASQEELEQTGSPSSSKAGGVAIAEQGSGTRQPQQQLPPEKAESQATDRGQGQRSDAAEHVVNSDMRKAYNEMKRAYDDMRQLLKKSMDECVRLSDEVVGLPQRPVKLEAQNRAAQATAQESAAATKAAKREAAEAVQTASTARQEAAAAQLVASQLQLKLEEAEAQSRVAAGTAELEELGVELLAAVRKATAAVEAKEAAEARAALAEAARQAAEAARNEADRMRRAAQAEAHAAIAAADAERSTRAEAEGLTETLKMEQERRARVFNNAVKAAVGRVQSELEAERDELQARTLLYHAVMQGRPRTGGAWGGPALEECSMTNLCAATAAAVAAAAAALQSQLREAQAGQYEARSELRLALAAAEAARQEADARTADAVAAGNLAASAESAAQRAAAREAEALANAHDAKAVAREAQAALDALQSAHEDLQASGAVLGGGLLVVLPVSPLLLTGPACQPCWVAAKARPRAPGSDRVMGAGLVVVQGACAAARAEADALRGQLGRERSLHEDLVNSLQLEVRRQQDRAEAAAQAAHAAERQLEQAVAAGREVAERSGNEAAAAAKRVLELEAELQQLRASSGVLSLFQLPTKQDVLAGLGLELWKDDRLRWKSEADMEAAPAVVRPVKARGAAAATGSAQAAAAKVLGVVPLRVWLIAGYLSLLHIAVMVSFTRTRDVSQLCVCMGLYSKSHPYRWKGGHAARCACCATCTPAGSTGWVEIHVEGEAASYRSGQSLLAIGQVTAQMAEVMKVCDNLEPALIPLAHRTCAEAAAAALAVGKRLQEQELASQLQPMPSLCSTPTQAAAQPGPAHAPCPHHLPDLHPSQSQLQGLLHLPGLSILTRPATNLVTSPAEEQQPIIHTTEEQDEQTMPPSMPKQQQDWATARCTLHSLALTCTSPTLHQPCPDLHQPCPLAAGQLLLKFSSRYSKYPHCCAFCGHNLIARFCGHNLITVKRDDKHWDDECLTLLCSFAPDSVMQLCTLGKKLSVKMLNEYCKAVGLYVPPNTLRADLRYIVLEHLNEQAEWDGRVHFSCSFIDFTPDDYKPHTCDTRFL